MRDPRAFDDHMFEPIHRRKGHGHHLAGVKRRHLPNCNGKHSYWTRQRAESTRTTLLAVGAATYLNVYLCHRCPYWHLTSQGLRTRP